MEQELGALGLAQIENIKHQHVAELTTDDLFEQELNLVTLGAPTPAAQAVIDAVIKIVADKRLHAFNSPRLKLWRAVNLSGSLLT